MAFVFAPQTYAAIAGEDDVVPSRHIYCVGWVLVT